MRGGLSYEMTSSCFQGGIQQLGRYQQNMLIEPSSPTEAWQYHQVLPKTEPTEPQTEITTHNNYEESEEEETKHDSGLLSGNSDLSPYSNSIIYPHHPLTPPNSYLQHPLTPPNSENEESLKRLQNHISSQISSPTTNRRISSPSNQQISSSTTNQQNSSPITNRRISSSTNEDFLKKYQFGASNNDFLKQSSENDDFLKKFPNRVSTPPNNDFLKQLHKKSDFLEQTSENDDFLKRLHNTVEKSISSPKMSENSDKSDDEYDEQGIKIPRVNSHGKIKTFKCKQCDFVAITKMVFWEHTKTHIKADKLLTCPKCPFVTEYKHHLEYHLRNHFGSKPFKCTQCAYSCVNKSMLNSHLKSHSNIYQYRCADCAYATKYCHSLKLHLRKYAHKPAMVLNPDGTPNPLPIIDVYGTRRGPKIKQSSNEIIEKKDDFDDGAKNTTNPLIPFPFFAGFPFFAPNPFILHNLSKIASAQEYRKSESEDLDCVLDLSKSDDNKNVKNDNNLESSDDDDDRMELLQNVEVVENINEKSNDGSGGGDDDNNRDLSLVDGNGFNCQFCQINFGEPVLYTMHMGYHGYKSPFTCNMCGEECGDKVEFFLHIARTKHS